jgi:hypothetical protein
MSQIVTITAEKAHDVLSRANQGEKFDYLPFQKLGQPARDLIAQLEARKQRGELPQGAMFMPSKTDYVWCWIPCRSH